MSAEKFRVVIYTNTCEKKVSYIPATEDITLICWGIWFLQSKILLPEVIPICAEHLAFVKKN
ncbi:PilI type IV pilus biogenesis protein [Escherichia coli]|nr:PilI type IV pilus biogenesis protein [Escherichia coli]